MPRADADYHHNLLGLILGLAREKIAAAFVFCILSYYNFLHTYNQNEQKNHGKKWVDDSSAS